MENKEIIEEISTSSYTREEKEAREDSSNANLQFSIDNESSIQNQLAAYAKRNPNSPSIMRNLDFFSPEQPSLSSDQLDLSTLNVSQAGSNFQNAWNSSSSRFYINEENLQKIFGFIGESVPQRMNEALEQSKSAVTKKIEDKRNELDSKNSNIEEQALEIDNYKQEVFDLKEQLLAKSEIINLLERQLESIENGFSRVAIDWEKPRQNIRKAIESPEHHLAKQLDLLESKYISLGTENLNKDEIIALKNKALLEYIDIANELAKKETSLYEELEALKVEIQEYIQIIAQLKIDNQRLDRKNSNLASELGGALDQKDRFEKLVNKGKKILEQNKKDSERLISENDNLQNLISDREALLARISKLETKLNLRDIDVNELTKRIDWSENRLGQQKSKISCLEAEVDHFKTIRKAPTISNLIKCIVHPISTQETQIVIDSKIDSITSYRIIRHLDNWSYEIILISFGALWLLKKLSKKWKMKDSQSTSRARNLNKSFNSNNRIAQGNY